jgi:hypothetical protein
MLIPDPDFCNPSRIQQQQAKRRVEKFVDLTFLVPTNLSKWNIILFLTRYRTKFEPNDKEL